MNHTLQDLAQYPRFLSGLALLILGTAVSVFSARKINSWIAARDRDLQNPNTIMDQWPSWLPPQLDGLLLLLFPAASLGLVVRYVQARRTRQKPFLLAWVFIGGVASQAAAFAVWFL